jgi:Cys-tRNA(Pro)/Cys-tRNA(Cys) deacylase
MITNNVTRLLDSRKIPYTAFELPVEKLSAEETASYLQIPLELVYKTIVIQPEKPHRLVLAVVPGTVKVDTKAVAAFLNEKKVHIPSMVEAERLTGMLAGGISPLSLIHHGFQVLLDDSAASHELIYISGGQRGLNIRLPVKAFILLTNARLAAISSPFS